MADIIQEGRNSGMSIRAWGRENNINEKKFYYWQRRIRTKVAEQAIEVKPEEKGIPEQQYKRLMEGISIEQKKSIKIIFLFKFL